MSLTTTKDDGLFAISTYEEGDGVPDGEYGLTFFWGTFSVMNRTWVGPDKLKDRYKDNKNPTVKFKVEGQPVDLGEIKLTTK